MADQTILQETLDNNIVDGDWLIYWKTSTGVQRRVARSSLLGATLTGAGTIATGGFTLTVPATGTAALKTGTPTAGQVAQWDDANTVESAGFAASDVALLAGRSGGQSLSGGTAANDDLTLEGTTNATRTTSYVIMQPNGGNVGIGTTSPTEKLFVKTATNRNFFIRDFSSTIQIGGLTDGSADYNTNFRIDAYNLLLNATTLGNVGIGTTSPGRKLHVAGTIIVDGDEGGISGTVGFTDVSDLGTRSTGVGTIKFDDATNRDSSGFVKIYIGTTAYYVPVFAAI